MKAWEKKQNNTKILLGSEMSQSEENTHIVFGEGIITLNCIKLHFCKSNIVTQSTLSIIQSNIKVKAKTALSCLETKIKGIRGKEAIMLHII